MKTRYIPDNILQGKRIANLIRPRNMTEGIVCCLLLIYVMFQIPFAPTFRTIVIIVLSVAILILNCIGIKNQSFSEALINFVRIRRYLKEINYRRVNNVSKENEPVIKDGRITTGKETIASKWYKKIFAEK